MFCYYKTGNFNNECCSYEAADCQDILDRHYRESGVYSVTPAGTYTSFHVYCDMENDPGGWLVRYFFVIFINTMTVNIWTRFAFTYTYTHARTLSQRTIGYILFFMPP